MLSTQRNYLVALAVFLVILTCSFYIREAPPLGIHRKPSVTPEWAQDDESTHRSAGSLRDIVTSLFKEIRHDPKDPHYRAPSGKQYSTTNMYWQKPLGKRILIVDIDTRVPTGDNQILNNNVLDYENLELQGGGLVSNGIINHYTYALIHGYDYKYYEAQPIPEHHNTWILPHVLRELISNYDFVVTLDADAIVSHLDVPLEWMFNRWGIHPNLTSMALPFDTEEIYSDGSISLDSKNNRVLNTGFVVAQNSTLTHELLEAWRDCTTEKRYPGCAQWKTNWSHEQRAFSEYIRYDFNHTPETIISIPCDDAVGYPGFRALNVERYADLSDCNGNFVSHYTITRSLVKNAGAYTIMQSLSEVLQRSLLKEKETLWYKEPKKEWIAGLESLIDTTVDSATLALGGTPDKGDGDGR